MDRKLLIIRRINRLREYLADSLEPEAREEIQEQITLWRASLASLFAGEELRRRRRLDEAA